MKVPFLYRPESSYVPTQVYGITEDIPINTMLVGTNVGGIPISIKFANGVTQYQNLTNVMSSISQEDLDDINTAIATKQNSLVGTGLVKSTSGTISYIADNSTNWDTAFTWGNHASAGYLTTSSASSTYVPYTGATANLNLGAFNISSATANFTTRIAVGGAIDTTYISKFQSTTSDNYNAFISTAGTGEYGIYNNGLYFQALNLAGGIQFYGNSAAVGLTISNTNNVSIGNAAGTARLHLPAGTATAGTAPLRFTSGTNTSTAATGQMEYNGTILTFTPTGTTRQTFAYLGLAQTWSATQTFSAPVVGTAAAGNNTTTAASTAFVQAANTLAVKDTNLSISANQTLTAASWATSGALTVFANANSAGITITLPTASAMAGLTLNVIKTDSSANGVTISLSGTNINGSANTSLSTQYANTVIKSNGTQFYIF